MRSETRTFAARATDAEEAYYTASSWVLMRRNLFKHRLSIIGGGVLIVLYVT